MGKRIGLIIFSFGIVLVLSFLFLKKLDSRPSEFTGPVNPGAPIPAELIDSLEEYVALTMQETGVPGLAMALIQGNRVIYSKGFGVRDLETGEPVTTDTLMGIGSSTKTMTAVMIASMVDDGLIRWDTPVRDIWPGFQLSDPEISDALTVRHMLCMCAGVPRRMEEITFRYSELSPESIIESLAEIPLVGPFERKFAYSSRMLAAGGFLAAMVDGAEYGRLEEGYRTVMQSRILDPLGMQRSTFSVDEAVASGNYATPYYAGLAGIETVSVKVEEIFRPIAPAGGLWSTVEDMSKYLLMLLDDGRTPDGRRLVSVENLEVLWEPGVRIDAQNHYGLGWHIENYKGVRVYHHPGGTAGFAAELVVLPDYDLGFVLLSNRLDLVAPIGRMATYRLLEMLAGKSQTYDGEIKAKKSDMDEQLDVLSQMTQQSVDPDAVERFLGVYENEVLGAVSLTLHPDDNSLWLDVGEYEIPLRRLKSGEDQYILYSSIFVGKTLTLGTDSLGGSVMTLKGDEAVYNFKRPSGRSSP